MKVLIKKLKNSNKIMLITFLLLTIGYITSFVFFSRSILSLEGIENFIRYFALSILGLWILFYFIFGLVTIIKKMKKTFITLSIITFLFIPIFSVSSYYIDKIYNKINNFSNKETSTYKSVLLTMKDKEITSSSKIGMIENKNDREGYILANELIKKEKLTNEIVNYDDYLIMLNSLYNNEIDGVLVSGSYKILFGNEEKFKQIEEDTKIVYSFSKEMKTEESEITSTKKLTEPFTVLVLGVDSEGQNGLNPNAPFNGDTLMLVTFNPNTLSTTMFSIPRDMYVPIACNNNNYNKINSAAAYGTSCVINTIKNMTDIDIDYFVKVNFKGVVDLVDSLGGIEVNVEKPDFSYDKDHKGLVCEQDSQRRFGEHLVCITPGENVYLNGEQALAYSRCRHLYLLSDISRNKHQQDVLEALANKMMKVSSFSDIEKILDTVSNNISTNMKPTQILSFYQTIKNMLMNSLKGEDFLKIQKTYLEFYNLRVYVPGAGYPSTLGYYPGSLNAISKAMKENLNILPIETIKTFRYDYNEDKDYRSDIIGKGIYSGGKLAVMPRLTGNSVTYAENWASANGITLNKEYVENDALEGLIINQNVHEDTLMKNVRNVTITISKGPKKQDPVKPEKPELPEIPGVPEVPEDPNTEPDPDPIVPGGPEVPTT